MAIPPSQIREINKLLLAYSAGEYHKKGKLSPHKDEIDSVIAGVNMLGEELLGTTVSRDYFSSIYNSVADMLFVLSHNGTIQDINNAVQDTLRYSDKFLMKKNISEILENQPHKFFSEIKKQLSGKASFSLETNFVTANKKTIPVSCVCSKIIDRHTQFKGYLLIAEDITGRKATERLIQKAEYETQEKERVRIAEEIHDSMQMKLASIHLLLKPMQESTELFPAHHIKSIITAIKRMEECQREIRNISFNLIPSELRKKGINAAIKRLADELNSQQALKFHYVPLKKEPHADKFLQIAIYRILQEFISNTIKHAFAKNIHIRLL